MKALDAKGYTERMAAAYGASEARHREVQDGLVKARRSAEQIAAERTEQVNKIERSFVYRLARRFHRVAETVRYLTSFLFGPA